MGWYRKQRGGKRGYYYRSVRVNGRAIKQYIGSGPAAELIADLEAERQESKRAAREARLRESAQLAVIEMAICAAQRLAAILVNATMILSGYYLHHGDWRRRRRESDSYRRETSAAHR
jgi:hypothetical protein